MLLDRLSVPLPKLAVGVEPLYTRPFLLEVRVSDLRALSALVKKISLALSCFAASVVESAKERAWRMF
jgi:hypothetical protein